MRKFFLILLLVACSSGFSQLSKLSAYEKRWAFFHPFAALKVKKITAACYPVYYAPSVKQQLDSFSSGGKLDAFRHVFFMAAYAQKINTKKLRKLGIAHEKANYRQFLNAQKEEGEMPDSLGSVMDLKNNELGLKTGSEHKKITRDALKQIVIAEIKSGHAFILKRNASGAYVDCNNNVVDLQKFYKTWYVPKCLMASDL